MRSNYRFLLGGAFAVLFMLLVASYGVAGQPALREIAPANHDLADSIATGARDEKVSPNVYLTNRSKSRTVYVQIVFSDSAPDFDYEGGRKIVLSPRTKKYNAGETSGTIYIRYDPDGWDDVYRNTWDRKTTFGRDIEIRL